MARKAQPSTVEDTPLPTQETTPSEPSPEAGAEETKPPEEGAAAPEPTEEKPDFATQLAELPEEERKALLKEHLGEELSRFEQSARDSAWGKLQTAQARQVQANQALQDTLKNLDTTEDTNTRAGHVQAYADAYVQSASQQWALEALEGLRGSLGVSREEHDEIILRLHQQAARENRVATFGDYAKHVVGEKTMPKGDVTKQIQAEVKAALTEQQGKGIESQAAPVSVGPGEPPKGTPTVIDFAAMTRKQRSELTEGQLKAMVREEYEARGIPYPL